MEIDFEDRRAPYAPISALERFFERMRDRNVPDVVDHKFLERMQVASNNEYALLSALKFLGVIDDRGRPTYAYRRLQSTDEFKGTLRHLVERAYQPLFELGGESWPSPDLVDYFRRTSSPSQAKNAARFFRAVSRLAGAEAERDDVAPPELQVDSEAYAPPAARSGPAEPAPEPVIEPSQPGTPAQGLLELKAQLLAKLPAPRPEWTAEEYRSLCETFLRLLENLDASAQ